MQVPEAYVERLDLVPDVDKGLLNVLVHGSAAAKGLKVGLTTLEPDCGCYACCLYTVSVLLLYLPLLLSSWLHCSERSQGAMHNTGA